MASVSKATIIGHLGSDPEQKTLPGGKNVCHFRVATSFGSKGNERTTWHSINAWDKTAELCMQYLKKGKQVYIEGRLESREYEKNGEKRFVTEITATQVTFLSSGGNATDSTRTSTKSSPDHDDDVPF